MRKQWATQNPGHSLPVAGQGPGARNPRAHSADTKALAIHLKTPARASTVAWQDGPPQRREARDADCDMRMCPALLPAEHIGISQSASDRKSTRLNSSHGYIS